MAITNMPPATSATGFHRIRCHTDSCGCAVGAGSPAGSAGSGVTTGRAGARVCRTTSVRLAVATRRSELEYRVAAMVATTDPTAAPTSVPATPRNEAATAEVTAARAPPVTWVRL